MKNFKLIFLAICAGLTIGLASCASNSDSSTNPVEIPLGNLVTKTECKSSTHTKIETYTTSEDAIEWEFTGGTLTLKHINTAFNCCPGTIYGNVKISKNTISIAESSDPGLCNCNCLYDLTYEIKNLSLGVYTISIPEAIDKTTEEPINFTIDLNAAKKGSKVYTRHSYPWGM